MDVPDVPMPPWMRAALTPPTSALLFVLADTTTSQRAVFPVVSRNVASSAPMDESLNDCTTYDTAWRSTVVKLLGDIAILEPAGVMADTPSSRPPWFRASLNFASRSWLFRVMKLAVSAARQYFQVCESIVAPIVILVMHDFISSEFATERAFHNNAMLKPIGIDPAVTIFQSFGCHQTILANKGVCRQ